MRTFLRSGWMLALGIVLAFAGPGAQLARGHESPEVHWQSVISAQIAALRSGDAPTAFGFASAQFHDQFADPYSFVYRIHEAGYAPIFESRGHRFGAFRQLSPTSVLQVVRLSGPDQSLYEAVYQLSLEAEGWRVEGVMLRRAGVSV